MRITKGSTHHLFYPAKGMDDLPYPPIKPGAQATYEIDETLDLSNSESLRIAAKAGDLKVRGGSDSQALIGGKVCASKEEWLDKATIETEGGRNAEIAVDLPETSGWSITGSNYAYIDLEVDVPRGGAEVVGDLVVELLVLGVGDLVGRTQPQGLPRVQGLHPGDGPGVVALALGARVVISGRPPVTNLYSSAVFIGWGCVAIGLLMEIIFRLGIGAFVSSVAGIGTLIIAHFLALANIFRVQIYEFI